MTNGHLEPGFCLFRSVILASTDVFADVAFARLVRRQRPVGHDEPGRAAGGQVVEKVLNPGVVGIAQRRDAVLPALVVTQQVSRPIRNVERRNGEDVVGFEVLVLGVEKRVGPRLAQVGLDAADGEVHVGQLPGGRVGLLAEDGDVADAPRCSSTNRSDWTNPGAPGRQPQHGSKTRPLYGSSMRTSRRTTHVGVKHSPPSLHSAAADLPRKYWKGSLLASKGRLFDLVQEFFDLFPRMQANLELFQQSPDLVRRLRLVGTECGDDVEMALETGRA